jgi:hypothetical protein
MTGLPPRFRPGNAKKLQPHWALALYLLIAALAAWAAFQSDAPGRPPLMSFQDLTAGLVEFYLFALLCVVNYRHDFLPIGRLVLAASILLCLSLSIHALYQLVLALRSPAYKTILMGAVLEGQGPIAPRLWPMALATAAFVASMLLMTRVKPRRCQAQRPSVVAFGPSAQALEPEAGDALPLDATLLAAGLDDPPGPFQRRRATDSPEIRDEAKPRLRLSTD